MAVRSTARIRHLDRGDPTDITFAREAFGFEAEERGWFRERDRLFVFTGALTERQACKKLRGPPPPSILDSLAPPLSDGPPSRPFLTMEDGTRVTWIRRPEGLPKGARPHWRGHRAVFEVRGQAPEFTAYTSVSGFAPLEGADGKFRILAPGGIRWVQYPSKAAACADALDMSLAVAMKIEVVRTPSAGNKIAVCGGKGDKGAVLRSLFSAYERMGFIATSADLGSPSRICASTPSPSPPRASSPWGSTRGASPRPRSRRRPPLRAFRPWPKPFPEAPPSAPSPFPSRAWGKWASIWRGGSFRRGPGWSSPR